MVKLKIGFSLNRSEGGPSGFLRKLRRSIECQELAKTSYCFDPTVSCNLFANRAYKFWDKEYVFRVDGIYFDNSHGINEIESRNKETARGIAESKGVIFQSVHSQRLVESVLGVIPKTSEIIINGTDLKKFSHDGYDMRNRLGIPKDAIVFITSAKWRNHKRLHDVIEVFKLFRNQSEKTCFLLIIGPTTEIHRSDNVIYLQHISNHLLPIYLRSADCYLFLSWLDPCPNSVVEAIACKIPVVCSNQGGTKEIVEATNGGIIANADADFDYQPTSLYTPPHVDYSVVVSALKDLFDNYAYFKNKIDPRPIDIDFVAQKYCNFIKSVLTT